MRRHMFRGKVVKEMSSKQEQQEADRPSSNGSGDPKRLELSIDVSHAFVDSYAIRLRGPGSYESTIPQTWVKREIRRLGISKEELSDYALVWTYDSSSNLAAVAIKKRE